MSEKVLITGGSGLIGTRLTALLMQKGYHVSHLVRSPGRGGVPGFAWSPAAGTMDDDALIGADAVIHLAGASIAGRRWTAAYKRDIVDSRVRSTRLLLQKIRSNPGVRALISASAIGYYGHLSREVVSKEGDKAGDDFLATVVRDWEAEVGEIGNVVSSVCMVRTGIVLSRDGGALPLIARPVRFGLGASLGSGEQIVSWVHIDDLCRAYIYLLEKKLSGAFNIVAPRPISNEALTRAIARRLGKPLWLPNVPEFVLKIVLGEMSEAVLTGNPVSSAKILEQGFRFQFDEIDGAISDLL